jgi:hypothetical protein
MNKSVLKTTAHGISNIIYFITQIFDIKKMENHFMGLFVLRLKHIIIIFKNFCSQCVSKLFVNDLLSSSMFCLWENMCFRSGDLLTYFFFFFVFQQRKRVNNIHSYKDTRIFTR